MAPAVKSHQPAITDLVEARKVLADVEAIPAHPTTKPASRLLALTAVRPGELWGGTMDGVRRARWLRTAVAGAGRTHEDEEGASGAAVPPPAMPQPTGGGNASVDMQTTFGTQRLESRAEPLYRSA